jgi:hypothetical protein
MAYLRNYALRSKKFHSNRQHKESRILGLTIILPATATAVVREFKKK